MIISYVQRHRQLCCYLCRYSTFVAFANMCHITHTHPFNGPLSGTTRVSQYQKGKTNLNFTGARDSEWQWHQLGQMQVCTLLQTDNHTSTSPLSFLQAGCHFCHPTNSVKALKANMCHMNEHTNNNNMLSHAGLRTRLQFLLSLNSAVRSPGDPFDSRYFFQRVSVLIQ